MWPARHSVGDAAVATAACPSPLTPAADPSPVKRKATSVHHGPSAHHPIPIPIHSSSCSRTTSLVLPAAAALPAGAAAAAAPHHHTHSSERGGAPVPSPWHGALVALPLDAGTGGSGAGQAAAAAAAAAAAPRQQWQLALHRVPRVMGVAAMLGDRPGSGEDERSGKGGGGGGHPASTAHGNANDSGGDAPVDVVDVAAVVSRMMVSLQVGPGNGVEAASPTTAFRV